MSVQKPTLIISAAHFVVGTNVGRRAGLGKPVQHGDDFACIFLRRLGSPACRARSIIARQRRCVLKISPRGRFSCNAQPATHNSREVVSVSDPDVLSTPLLPRQSHVGDNGLLLQFDGDKAPVPPRSLRPRSHARTRPRVSRRELDNALVVSEGRGHTCYFTSVREANFSRSCPAPLAHRRTVAYRHESLQVSENCQWNCPLHSGQSPVHVVALRRFFGVRAVDLSFPSAYRLGRSYG